MLDVSYLRTHKETAIQRLKKRTAEAAEIIERVLTADDKRKQQQASRDALLADANRLSKQIGEKFREGAKAEAEKRKAEAEKLKQKSQKAEEKVREAEQTLHDLLYEIPNLPHTKVPKGYKETDNEVLYERGERPAVRTDMQPHWELAKTYGFLDMELGSKLTGGGFPVYLGQGAKLQRALINFFLDEAGSAGYQEIEPPILVNPDTAYGTGQLPDKEGQMYRIEKDNLYLIPTAEVPLTNIYRGEILSESDFPIRMTAYTPCFRREAGSYGKGVRGLNRVHQFDKVELVQIQHPDKAYDTLEEMRSYVEGLLDKLELPYRVTKLCAGDLGFAAAFTYDMEVWSAAQQKWLEASSISNFESFQSNRMKLRYRDEKNGKPRLAHTLNGSGLALPRIVAALLENNQQADGIYIPKALQHYTGFDKIKRT